VAVLAIDLTWPDVTTVEGLPYEPWTVAARWEQMIVEKVEGFGGVLLPHAPSMLLFAFGLPQTMEQVPQRAVHAALALQELAGDESPLAEEGTRPVLRLGLHWGPVLMAIQARDTSLRVLAVGDTLAMPVRLSGQAAPGEMLTSATMGRVVESWCALQPWAGIVGPGRDEHLGIAAIVRAQSGVERLAAQTSRRGLRLVGPCGTWRC
jgi:class 3 adenylate cyclase